MTPSNRQRLKESVMLQEDAGLLLDTDTGRVLELNKTACAMVKHLRDSGGEVLERLHAEFNDIDKAAIEGDLSDLLARLKDLGFLETDAQD